MRALSVRFENVGKDNRVCKTVRHAVVSAERMRDCVYVSDVGTGERATCDERSVLHFVSCFKVVAVVVSLFQILMDKLNCLDAVLFGLCGVFAADVTFDCVSQSVHTGGGSNVRGQTDCEFGIHHDIPRYNLRVVNGVFFMRIGIADNSGKSCFRTCAGRRGNRDERGKFSERFAQSNFQHAFKLGYRFFGKHDARADAFCTVHGRTAAESDNDVAIVFLVNAKTVFDVGDGGIGHYVMVNDSLHSFFFKSFFNGVGNTEFVQAAVGNDKRAGATFFFLDPFGKLFD